MSVTPSIALTFGNDRMRFRLALVRVRALRLTAWDAVLLALQRLRRDTF